VIEDTYSKFILVYGIISADSAWIKLNTPPQQLKVGNYLPKIGTYTQIISFACLIKYK